MPAHVGEDFPNLGRLNIHNPVTINDKPDVGIF